MEEIRPAGQALGTGRPRMIDSQFRRDRRLRILVADDNCDAVDTLALLLTMEGHTVYLARCGVSALQLACEKHPEVLILDIGLPGLDGHQLAQRIRQQPDLCDAKLIALSGYGQDGDRQLSIAAGFDFHFVKPLEFQKLLDLFATVR